VLSTFRRNLLPPSSTPYPEDVSSRFCWNDAKFLPHCTDWKLEASAFSETLVTFYQATRSHIFTSLKFEAVGSSETLTTCYPISRIHFNIVTCNTVAIQRSWEKKHTLLGNGSVNNFSQKWTRATVEERCFRCGPRIGVMLFSSWPVQWPTNHRPDLSSERAPT
jgi:hypothetical protein